MADDAAAVRLSDFGTACGKLTDAELAMAVAHVLGQRPAVKRQIGNLLASTASTASTAGSTAATAAAAEEEHEAERAYKENESVTTAIRALQQAEATVSTLLKADGIAKALANAQDLLRQRLDEQGAALALTHVNAASQAAVHLPLQPTASKAISESQKACRDVVVWRCCRRGMRDHHRDAFEEREAFEKRAEKAFGCLGHPLERGLRAQLFLAYRKVKEGEQDQELPSFRRKFSRKRRPSRPRTAPPPSMLPMKVETQGTRKDSSSSSAMPMWVQFR